MNTRNANPARRIINESTRRRLAVLADVDPRTIDRVLLGEPVRGAAGIRALAVVSEYVPDAASADAGGGRQ